MAEDVRICAAGIFEGIRQHRCVAEVAAVVHLPGHRHDQAIVPGQPGRIERNGTEGVAEDVTEKRALLGAFKGWKERRFHKLPFETEEAFKDGKNG